MICEIRRETGAPVLYINGSPEVPILFFGNTDLGKHVTAQVRLAAENGFHLHSVNYNLHFDGNRSIHCSVQDNRAADPIADLCRCLDAVLVGDPDAYIFLRVKVGAYFTDVPKEWQDELITFADGSHIPDGGGPCLVSTSSDKWARAVDEKLTEIVTFMRTSEQYRDHIACIHLENCEWFEYGFRESGSDCSAVADAKFMSWQRAKYGKDAPVYPVPRDLPNNRSFEMYDRTLLTLPEESRYIDYFDFINDLVSDRILQFSRTVKKASQNELLVIAFYGYYFELADCQSGHYAMHKLLTSPDIDGFAGPVSYSDRTQSAPKGAVGATSAYMTAVDSITRMGKMWFQESDQRTCVNGSDGGGWLPGTASLDDLFGIHRREIGDILLHRAGLWAMDLMDTGWLLDASIWQRLADLRKRYRAVLLTPPSSFDTVFVVDEHAESVVGQPSFCGISGNLLSAFRYEAYRAGISFAMAEISEVAAGKFDDARLFVFLNPYRIGHMTAAALHHAIGDRFCVWMYGFGETASEDVRYLTGMDIALTSPGSTVFEATANVFPAPKSGNTVTHRYAAQDGEVLGRYENGDIACARAGKHLFCGATALSAEMLRAAAHMAGIHVYTEGHDVFLTDNRTSVYAASDDGEKTVILPNGHRITFDMRMGETVYMELTKEEFT